MEMNPASTNKVNRSSASLEFAASPPPMKTIVSQNHGWICTGIPNRVKRSIAGDS
jgi:hypothetical protein